MLALRVKTLANRIIFIFNIQSKHKRYEYYNTLQITPISNTNIIKLKLPPVACYYLQKLCKVSTALTVLNLRQKQVPFPRHEPLNLKVCSLYCMYFSEESYYVSVLFWVIFKRSECVRVYYNPSGWVRQNDAITNSRQLLLITANLNFKAFVFFCAVYCIQTDNE